MKHYGDICKINGADVEPVNVVIGGSPCQGLSVAGKQEGLGILNRAEKRGKELPEILKKALIQQSQRGGGLIAYKVTASTDPLPQDATEKDG